MFVNCLDQVGSVWHARFARPFNKDLKLAFLISVSLVFQNVDEGSRTVDN